jgi:hypothetical protein
MSVAFAHSDGARAALSGDNFTQPHSLLQLNSGSHVLGFGQSSLHIASIDHALRIDFVNSNISHPVSFSGKDDLHPHENQLKSVRYNELWDDVALVYESENDSITKSTYYIKAHEASKNPVELIQLAYNVPVTLTEAGEIVLNFNTGKMIESPPISWQEINGVKIPVASSFRKISDHAVGFSVESYDPNFPLIIDPSISWHTFLGQGGTNLGRAITVDASNNVYVTGSSNVTWGDPVTDHSSGYDGFIAKLSSSGSLTWNTFFGGSGSDNGHGIAVDTSGNIYVAGYSTSNWGSPIVSFAGGFDAFGLKFDSSGNLTWHTFMGGSSNEYGWGIALDASGNTYIGGESWLTWGSPVRAHNSGGGWDAFVTKLDNDGARVWHTFLGDGGNSDVIHALTVDSSSNVYVAGNATDEWTESPWFDDEPIRADDTGLMGMVAKLNSNGVLQWYTFLGGSGSDSAYGIALDSSGNIFVSGESTATWGSPKTAHAGGDDIYVAKLNSAGALQWNTFLGSSDDDSASSTCGAYLSIDASGDPYIAGYSATTWGTPLKAHAGGNDGFAARLSAADGSLTWNLFSGSTGNDTACSIAVDSAGDAYLAGSASGTWGTPVRAYTSGTDIFVEKVTDSFTLTAAKDGAGTGTITSAPAGINCGLDCSEAFTSGGAVTLTATVDVGMLISAWSGGGCSGTGGTCIVTVSDDTTVTVTFAVANVAPVATAQSLSTNEDTAKSITLSGTDANDDSLTFTVVSQPASGTLSGTVPNLIYTPTVNFAGSDSFTFKTNDGTVDGNTATISLTVGAQNDAPVISDEPNLTLSCTNRQNCALPSWTASDVENDSLTASWRETSGNSKIQFTNDGELDLINYTPKRGKYYVQYVVGDGTTESTSETVAVDVPNNEPIVASDDDIEITGAVYRDSKYVIPKFTREADISAIFTDYDDDSLSYSWSLDIGDSDRAGFVSTSAGASKLRVRMAGDIKITIKADDGYGGSTTEEIIVSIPVPSITDDELALTIDTWDANGSSAADVTGSLKSSVWPIVVLNGVKTAAVTLSKTASSSISAQRSFATTDSSSLDTYTFTAEDVPAGTDYSKLDIAVYTSVNGENVSLSTQTASLSGAGGDTEAGDTEEVTETDDLGTVKINANWGCALLREEKTQGYLR